MSGSKRQLLPKVLRVLGNKKRVSTSLMATMMVTGLLVAAFPAEDANAAQITVRSLTLQAGDSPNFDGGSRPGGIVKHRFSFTIPSTTTIGSIKFEYCTTASVTACTTPVGLSTTAATLTDQTGATGFSANGTTTATNGAPYITRTAATGTGAVAYQLSAVTNPNVSGTPNYTFFVRISTYASTNATGGATDTGSVAASTSTQIQLTGTMPESLIFCTGGTISTTSSIPDCSTATSGSIAFDQLFSPSDTATAKSQMAASTNAGFGYVITVNGPTLTSGSNTIARMTNGSTGPIASTVGTGQFGLNLRANTTVFDNQTTPVALGTNVAPAVNGTNYRGQARTDYATDNFFEFTTGDTVAASDNGGAGGTDAQIFTASYIVNVSGSQPAGTYVSTLTYICTPTF